MLNHRGEFNYLKKLKELGCLERLLQEIYRTIVSVHIVLYHGKLQCLIWCCKKVDVIIYSLTIFLILAASEDVILAQMEIFIIVIAVIAVAAAIILLVLLQLRIKKQTTAENSTAVGRRARAQASVAEEIALDYPNDEILKNGPPPYRQGIALTIDIID